MIFENCKKEINQYKITKVSIERLRKVQINVNPQMLKVTESPYHTK